MTELNQPLTDSKAAFDAAVSSGDRAGTIAAARTLLKSSPTMGTAAQVIRSVPLDLPNRAGVILKVAILRSFTIEPVLPLLKALGRLHGVDLQAKVGEFNSYVQEVIDPHSWLYEFDPDVVVVAVQTRDASPSLWHGSPDLTSEEAITYTDAILRPITALLEPLRSRSKASVIIHAFEQPSFASSGLLDSRRQIGQLDLIELLNSRLKQTALQYDNVYILEYDRLISRFGRERWHDETKWLTSRSPIAGEFLMKLAEEYLRFFLPLSGRTCKVLVVDLDNTLWGGVVGEDGINGIKIGPEYPGAAFLELQRAILNLYNRGILLAICSKNNLADAMEALDNRPEMLLKPSHFAAIRINWVDKAQNIREIAAELNVGIDSLSFIDDNPVERERVKQEIPELFVVDLPSNPMEYASVLRNCAVFERLSLTAEDRERGRYYAEQRARQSLESSTGSLEEFYWSLDMRAEFVTVNPETLARIAQLTQKTNQLNTTTRRYTEIEVQEIADNSNWRIFGIKIQDKFGDNGLVGVVFLQLSDQKATIDTFLLSCRVIGRTVETAMLARVCDLARDAGCTEVEGWFLPTRKNAPASKIYSDHRFAAQEETDAGTRWVIELDKHHISQPEWIK